MLVQFCCDARLGDDFCGHTWSQTVPRDSGRNTEVSCPACQGTVGMHQAMVLDYEAPIAVVVLTRHNDRILSVSRRDRLSDFGLPGGKIDPDDGSMDPVHRLETLSKAAVRELWEETGVSIQPSDLTLILDQPEVDGYWCFYFEAPAELCLNATTQPDEGRVAWCLWDDLLVGPFGTTIQRLRDHLWRVEFGEPPEQSDAPSLCSVW